MSFTQTPLLGLSLFAIEVPGHGAQTLFADAAQAVGRLHPQTRVTLETGRILNIAGYGTNFSGRRRERDCDSREPRTEHPGIGPHPITGEPVLRVNQLSTAHVVGLAEGDSDDLLHEVFDVLYHPGNIYEHSWQVGDLVVFDNIAVHHARRDFDPAERRTLQRVVLSDRASLALSPDVAQLYAEAGTT
jgi:taurine dioxygenase